MKPEYGGLLSRFISFKERLLRFCISPIHTFVNIPALLLKNTLRFLIRPNSVSYVFKKV